MQRVQNYNLKPGQKINIRTAKGFSSFGGISMEAIQNSKSRINSITVIKEYKHYIIFELELINNGYKYKEAINKGSIVCGDAYFQIQ